MEVVFGLVGVVVGAVVAFAGQVFIRRREEKERWLTVLLEECANLYVLEQEFRGGIWLAYGEGDFERLRQWGRTDRRMSGTKLRLVCTDSELVDSAERLTALGKQVWNVAKEDPDGESWRRLMDDHERALDDFVRLAQQAARDQSVI